MYVIIGYAMNDEKDVFYFRDTREEAKRVADILEIKGYRAEIDNTEPDKE